MSLDAFNKSKDLAVKTNMESTIDPKKDSKRLNLSDIVNHKDESEKSHKRSITFSITDSQLKKIDKEARNRGFKNRSSFLSSIIDAL